MEILKCVSFNVNGLNETVRRKRVLTYLKNMKVDIVFIQETALTSQKHEKTKETG